MNNMHISNRAQSHTTAFLNFLMFTSHRLSTFVYRLILETPSQRAYRLMTYMKSLDKTGDTWETPEFQRMLKKLRDIAADHNTTSLLHQDIEKFFYQTKIEIISPRYDHEEDRKIKLELREQKIF